MTKTMIEKCLQSVVLENYTIGFQPTSVVFVDRVGEHSFRIKHDDIISMMQELHPIGKVMLTIEFMEDGEQALKGFFVKGNKVVKPKPTRVVPDYHKQQIALVSHSMMQGIGIQLYGGSKVTKTMVLSEDLLLDILYELYHKTYEEEV
ncbi:MAG TPA: hypothetical protein VJ869_04100 [Sphaerochaeta sp.]|nr:hypothetical protein [Sphaerochaeta sp.]